MESEGTEEGTRKGRERMLFISRKTWSDIKEEIAQEKISNCSRTISLRYLGKLHVRQNVSGKTKRKK